MKNLDRLEDTLQHYFGHDSFRWQQKKIIEHILEKKHAFVLMPTGMGKSLCYQIPALVQENLTIVISPLIALMKDQVDTLQKKKIAATFINSSLKRQARESRYQEVKEGKYCLLYITPERFRKTDFLEVLACRKVDLLAVDEAHCISEWGHDFRPDYTRLQEIRQLLGNPTTIALTATATPRVQQDIIAQLGLESNEIQLFHQGIDRPNLSLAVEEMISEEEKIQEICHLIEVHPGSGIVYFSLIKTLDRFSEKLESLKIPHFVYHGMLHSQERSDIQEKFMKGNDNLVLATNAFGMGIDKEDIRFVIHAEIPGSMEAYYQEIGRAGRDGKESNCTLLYDERDLMTQMEFVRWSNPSAELYERVYQILTEDRERIIAFGIDWLKEKLHDKNRHDYRLETVLAMFDRYGVIEGNLISKDLEVVSDLPMQLKDSDYLEKKLKQDHEKLYSLVQYVKYTGNRKAFIHEYFGLPFPQN